MKHALCRLAGYGAIVTVLSLPYAMSHADDRSDRPAGFHQTVRWESSSASSAKGLMFFRSSAQGAIKRMLIESPDGRPLVLTRELLVQHGVDREELRDEETGWHVELTKRFTFRATSLSAYFARASEWKAPGEGKKVELTLRTSTGLLFSAAVPLQAQPAQEHASFAALLKREIGEELALDLPEGLSEALAFLEAAFERSGSDARGIIEILSAALGISSEGAGTQWRQVDSAQLRSLELVDADDIAFASNFPSVVPITPLPIDILEVLADKEQEANPPGP